MKTPPARRHLWLILSAVCLGLDLATKSWAIQSLKGAPAVKILPILNMVYVENTGAAFGIFAGGGSLTALLLITFTLLAIGVIIYYLHIAISHLTAAGCALILGGALGNLHDRILHGHVVDFIDIHWGAHHWPAFNIADTAITTGALLFAIGLIFEPPAPPPPSDSPESV